jgi:ABC-type lipoprotein release transport system permease subunit
VLALVRRDGLRAVRLGAVVGVGGTLAAGRLVGSLLHGISPHDPLVLAGVMELLLDVATLASLVPGLRAAGANPVEVLRVE